MRSLDTNKNGQIDSNEAEGPRRYFVSRLAERAGMKTEFPIPINRLKEGLQKQYEGGDSKSGNDSGKSDGSGKKKDSTGPLVPAFGVEQDLQPVLKFGEAPTGESAHSTRSSSRPHSSGSSSPSASSSGGVDEKIKRWAEVMMRQYDRNHNGRLERDEIQHMRDEHKSADRNRDGIITREELAARLSEYARSRGGDNGSRDDRSRSESRDSNDSRSYRSRLPSERWPEGIPEWFAEKDADGDGQVAMAEYASFWTNATADKFSRYDPNNDGVITPRECLETIEQEAEFGSDVGKSEKSGEEIAKSEKKDGGEVWSGW